MTFNRPEAATGALPLNILPARAAATSAVGGGARPITCMALAEEAVPATFITVRTCVFLALRQDARSCSLRCDEMYLPQRQSRSHLSRR